MQINDYVVYNTEGICKIEDMVCPDFVEDKSKQYFVLVPVENASAKAYVPVELAEQRCRKLITAAEAENLIATVDEIEVMNIPDDKEREGIYRAAIEDGDLRKVIAVLKNILIRREQRAKCGKKTTAVDDKYYRIADRNLCHELGFVLHLSVDEVRARLGRNE